ncbi:phospholipase effector Tle1 domain-containing protein [Kluyvera cryocrescens]|uniref:T6SS phospholipase effector Tle1-like catalytic domain-containing protein n=1 Tax=Kluyvera cryocrescens TaxID=580 RepID=UPI0039F67753
MSEVTPVLTWYPPSFPAKGRLPSHAALTRENCKKQDSQELAYHNELCLAANRRVAPPCCKTLHVSLFFDGTGNNINYDLYTADPKHPTNIARLFRASIGQGYAAGTGKNNQALVDLDGSAGNKYYKYYIPGVGTPFPEVMDLDFSLDGLAAATGGENRINWGLLRLVDALRRTLGKEKLSDAENWKSVKAMATDTGDTAIMDRYRRQAEFQRLLNNLNPELKTALLQPEPGKQKLLGIKLYVYGFSRGAAAARAFVNWLNELMPAPDKKGEPQPLCLTSAAGNIPLSVEFLGLLDTVASVGVPHMAPVAEGHMGWADGTMELPASGLVKRCIHLVSSHEQRLCFPLDSLCRTNGSYPANSVEVVYPGMHSDVGGGYPPGDQGKAGGESDRKLLSQIPLNELYAAAFEAGAPLKVPKVSLPGELQKDAWRIMPVEVIHEFSVDAILVQRFNHWRTLTLGLSASDGNIIDEQESLYSPVRAPVNIINALENQMAWITAWRINRYAGGSYTAQPFYADSAANKQNQDIDPQIRKQREDAHALAQRDVEMARRKEIVKHARDTDFVMLPAGPKDFDAALAQEQLRQAAIEFREDYQEKPRSQTKSTLYAVMDYFKGFAYAFNQDNVPLEFKRIKHDGESHLAALFPSPGKPDESSALVRALFDDQVHDSRAWFMHNALGSREPWGSYFLYRMIYFGEAMSKQVRPLAALGYVAEKTNFAALRTVRFQIEMASAS